MADYNVVENLLLDKREAFEWVFDRYFNALCGFGTQYVKDQFIVEDIVQETFISFWGKRKDFEHENAIKAFLYTSVKNKSLNHIKHQAVVQKHDTELTHQLESDQYFTENLIEEDVFNQLYIEINHLPLAGQRIMLLALSGSKNQEIADELNISINTVKTQKKIAYAKLKDRLAPNLQAVLLVL